MLHWVAMDLVHLSCLVAFVANEALPDAARPDSAFACLLAVFGSMLTFHFRSWLLGFNPACVLLHTRLDSLDGTTPSATAETESHRESWVSW